MTTSQKIKVVSIIMIAGLVTKLFGFLREILVAARFGATIETDAFLIAFSIPTVLFVSIGTALSTVFIPVFSEYLALRSREEAFRFAANLLNVLLALCVLLTLAGIALAPQIVSVLAPGFTGYAFDLAVKLTRIMLPLLVILMATYIQTGILQSFEQFIIPAVISIPYNLVLIVFLLYLDRFFGIVGLSVATVLGWSLQVFIQIPPIWKTGFRMQSVFNLKDPGLTKVLFLAGPVVLGASAQQVVIFVNQALASGIAEGSVAALNFSNKLFLIGTGVFAMAITTYLLPGLSRLAARQEYSALKQNVHQALKVTLLLLTPVMLGLILLRVPLVQIILERGAFTPEATAMTSGALLYFALGTLGFAGQEVLNKAFYALQDSKTPMKLALVSTGVNVILSLVLVRWMGLNGLALGNAIGYTLLAVLLWRGLQLKWGSLE